MKQDDKIILKAICIALAIGLFYGGIGTSIIGATFVILGSLTLALLTMFEPQGIGDIIKVGVLIVLSGLADTLIGYFLTNKTNLDKLKEVRDIMLPVIAISGCLTMFVLMTGTIIIYYHDVFF